MKEAKLYRISEVTRLLGVTRSALHGYDAKGILSPTIKKGEGGYWYYDEDALIKLKLIEIFKEAGCSRKQIKELLSSPKQLLQAYQEAKARLEEKRKSLVSEICFLELLEKIGSPLSADSSSGKSFQSQLREVKSFFTGFSYESEEEAKAFLDALSLALMSEKGEGKQTPGKESS